MTDLPPPSPLFTSPESDSQSSDQRTTLAQLKTLVDRFVEERDWRQFHSPKNLSMSLSIEAAELMEHFQWLTVEQSRDLKNDTAAKGPIAEELADVMCYALANELGIDLSQAIGDKMHKNILKYPAEAYRGRYR